MTGNAELRLRDNAEGCKRRWNIICGWRDIQKIMRSNVAAPNSANGISYLTPHKLDSLKQPRFEFAALNEILISVPVECASVILNWHSNSTHTVVRQ
ncbi:hypothetical protein CDAR_474331 [Caerostris darwini]|uniref:Uncharacterized protein n=1 Tax=Caerostris darwini TaxID=1538125 RepID=A0AAV4M5P8_9ARAC|nr:hypothetical protein CDAR_474331 [Caerostris darwini]